MNVAAVEAWLQSFAGLESAAIGPDAVARAARERLQATGCPSVEAYLARLAESTEERNALLDRVVVPETWFFRDRPALDALARHVVEGWSREHPRTVFRVLSVPCSTGEEPYSLAMAFALAGWPLDLLRIDAVDISCQNLERATLGVYGRNSFRGDDLGFRHAFLEPADGDAWQVSRRLRAPISFEVGNLLAEDFPAGRKPYDAIFCRNLLIYFDRATQARAVRMLDQLLAPAGWFAVGPAEPALLLAHGYEMLKVRGGFVLRRSAVAGAIVPPPVKAPALAPAAVPWREIARPAAAASDPTPAGPSAGNSAALLAMQQQADAGRLHEARTQGETLLAQEGPSAPLLFLLGVIAEAAGDMMQAEELYRKTLYLEPGHTEALGHLAARAELKGDLRTARAFRERAQRALVKEAK
jgi:chemotaxis protein methyltransferase WspC